MAEIITSNARGYGILQKGDFDPTGGKMANSTSYGWGCAQDVRVASPLGFTENSKRRMWVYSYVPIRGKEVPELLTEWINTLNNELRPLLSDEEMNFYEILPKIYNTKLLFPEDGTQDEKVKDYSWVIVRQRIPARSELKPAFDWTNHMNLALFSLIRYLYRTEYVLIPAKALDLLKNHEDLSFLEAVWLAHMVSYGPTRNLTFTIHSHQKELLPVKTFAEALNRGSKNGIMLGFSGFYLRQPIASNTAAYIRLATQVSANNQLIDRLLCFIDKNFEKRSIFTDKLEEALKSKRERILIELLKEAKTWGENS